MENIFFMAMLSPIGGTETFFYYLAKKYKTKDITFIIKYGDAKQIERLRKYHKVIIWNGKDTYKCKRLFCNYFTEIVDFIEAEEYIQILHTDYKEQKNNLGMVFVPNKKVTRYIGVSKIVCEHFKEVTGLDAELCYNPIAIDKPKRVLNLVSATRLTNEKGKDRMIKLGKLLDEANIPYLWLVFTNDTNAIRNENIIYMKPRLDISSYIANADYLVQLSSNGEGFGYTPAEALTLGTPVIVTPCDSFIEIGVENNKNGFIVPFNMEGINVLDIYNASLKFDYKKPKDNWNKLLGNKKTNYISDYKIKCIVKVKEGVNFYYDTIMQRNVYEHEGEYEVSKPRAEQLVDAGVCVLVKEL